MFFELYKWYQIAQRVADTNKNMSVEKQVVIR